MDLAVLNYLDGVVSNRVKTKEYQLLRFAAKASGNPLEAQLDVACQWQCCILKMQFPHCGAQWGRYLLIAAI